ncbi:MAG: cytochrome c oxidase assembly protein [Anaerolineales bacterium]
MKEKVVWFLVVSSFLLAAPAQVAHAHEGRPLAPHDLWVQWNWNITLWLGLILTAWCYRRGLQVLQKLPGRDQAPPRQQQWAFAGGLLALFVALISPLNTLGLTLFSAHTVQHDLLMLAAAPLLVLSKPLNVLRAAVPALWRYRAGRFWKNAEALRASWQTLTQPGVVLLLHAGLLWAWHLPGLYQATRDDGIAHLAAHVSFFGMALLFWAMLFQPPSRRWAGYRAGGWYVLGMAAQSLVFGTLILLARAPWYPDYQGHIAAWRLTPLGDQRLAALFFGIPAVAIYLWAASSLFAIRFGGVARPTANPASSPQPTPTDQAEQNQNAARVL